MLLTLASCKKEGENNATAESTETTETTNPDNKMTFDSEALKAEMIAKDGSKTTLQDILAEHKGTPMVIDVWASWCPDCVKGMPKVKALQKQFPDVTYLFLSYDKTPESWKEGIVKNDVNGVHYLIGSAWKGGAFSKAIKLDWIPRYIVVDKESNIALFRTIEADDEELIATLNTIK